jgi:hypothetical protein
LCRHYFDETEGSDIYSVCYITAKTWMYTVKLQFAQNVYRCPDIASRFAWNDVVVKAIEDYRAANVTHEETRHDLLSSVADAASMFTNLMTGGAVSGPLRMKRYSELLSHNAQTNAGAGSGAGDNNAGNDSDRSPAAGNHVPFQSSSSASPLFPPLRLDSQQSPFKSSNVPPSPSPHHNNNNNNSSTNLLSPVLTPNNSFHSLNSATLLSHNNSATNVINNSGSGSTSNNNSGRDLTAGGAAGILPLGKIDSASSRISGRRIGLGLAPVMESPLEVSAMSKRSKSDDGF